MLDTWHLPKVKLLFRVLLNSSALLFNELSHFGQVCGKYFCVSQALCLFLSIVLCRSMVPTLTLQIPCNTLKTHPQVKKMVLKYWCLVCFVLESFCDHQWSQYGCVEKVDLKLFFWCWLKQIVLHLFQFQLTYRWGEYHLYSLSYKINVLK